MLELFHVAPILLAPGSVILAGNWGRIVQSVGASHPAWERELSLEEVRVRLFPEKPSRLNATFALPNLDSARLYRQLHAQSSTIYRVALADLGARTHVGDYNCVDPLPGTSRIRDEASERYWIGADVTHLAGHEQTPCIEVVCASALVIINRAE